MDYLRGALALYNSGSMSLDVILMTTVWFLCVVWYLCLPGNYISIIWSTVWLLWFFFSSFVILLAKLLSNPRINSWASTRCLPTQDIILRWHCHTCMSDDDVESVGHIMIMSLQLWGSKVYDNPRMKLKLDESICR